MLIPFSPSRSFHHVARTTKGASTSRRHEYMTTALAVRLLPEDHDDGLPNGTMAFLEHLEELRRRLISSCVAIAVGTLVAFVFIDRMVTFVLAPARHALPPGARLIYTQPGEAFGLYVEVALIAGALMAAPFVMFQIWRFIAPALYAREKKLAFPFVLLTTVGAIAGAAFSHYVMFPSMMSFFGTFSSPDLVFLPRLEDAFDLYVKLLVGMIVVFQIPTFAFFLAVMGLVTARFLWRNFKYAFLLIFVVAAVVTPTADPWDQLVFAAPMIGLYVVSIGIVWAAQRTRRGEMTLSPRQD